MIHPNISTVSSRNRYSLFSPFSFDAIEHFKWKIPTHWVKRKKEYQIIRKEQSNFWHSQWNVSTRTKKKKKSHFKCLLKYVLDSLRIVCNKAKQPQKAYIAKTLHQNDCVSRSHCEYEWDICFVLELTILNPYEIMECNPINFKVLRSLLCSHFSLF